MPPILTGLLGGRTLSLPLIPVRSKASAAGKERLRVQRDELSLIGHPQLQSERMRDLLFRAHQLLRVSLKLAARWHAR